MNAPIVHPNNFISLSMALHQIQAIVEKILIATKP